MRFSRQSRGSKQLWGWLCLEVFWSTRDALQGQGQVLGMGDTGIDASQCFFRDYNVSFSGFQTEPLATSFSCEPLQFFDSTTHRKIRQASRLFTLLPQYHHIIWQYRGRPV